MRPRAMFQPSERVSEMAFKTISIKGEVALVVGNHSFPTKGLALALAEADARVAVAAPQGVIASIKGANVSGLDIRCQITDITNEDETNKFVNQTVAQWGKVDILVNTADLKLFKPICETSQSEWRQVIDSSLTPAFLWCQAVGRQMLKQKKGRVINVISGLSQRGLSNGVAYCASQGGLKQMTEALALEWARDGIRVNAIGLGWFAEAIEPDHRLERYVPQGRLGMEGDLASLVVYLASDAGEYMTGSCLFIDGGAMAHA